MHLAIALWIVATSFLGFFIVIRILTDLEKIQHELHIMKLQLEQILRDTQHTNKKE
jgi:hypothetical protein